MKNLKTYILEGFKLGKNKVKKEEDWIDLGLPSKTLWCKYNVGATCESKAKSWYGDYFVWGDMELATNKKCDWTNYKYSNDSSNKLTKYCPSMGKNYWGGTGKPDNKLILDLEDDMAYANMDGEDWKMPTKEQCQELINNTTFKWVRKYNDISGLKGILFTSKINNNTLFIPAAGFRDTKAFYLINSYVGIWSSTLNTNDPTSAYIICSSSTNSDLGVRTTYRDRGFSVRAVMNYSN